MLKRPIRQFASSQISAAMRGYTTYIASKRNGGRTSCADGKVRISATISEAAFLALRKRASAAHRGLSREVAEILEQAVAAPKQVKLSSDLTAEELRKRRQR
jgi:hypothetical protein